MPAIVEDTLLGQQFYAAGGTAYQDALRTDVVFGGADVKAYIKARAAGGNPDRPLALPLDAAKDL